MPVISIITWLLTMLLTTKEKACCPVRSFVGNHGIRKGLGNLKDFRICKTSYLFRNFLIAPNSPLLASLSWCFV